MLIRFSNLADRFDAQGQQTRFFDILTFAQKFILDANSGKAPEITSVKIEELSLSGNMWWSEVAEHHLQYKWRGEDDHTYLFPMRVVDTETQIALEPQRIRQFRFTYVKDGS